MQYWVIGSGNQSTSQGTSYYWQYESNNQSFTFNSANKTQLILPAVNYPRQITLNISKSSLNTSAQADLYFYMNQENFNVTQDLYSIPFEFDFQGKKGLNIIDWEYSGSLHATIDPVSLSGAVLKVRIATRVYI